MTRPVPKNPTPEFTLFLDHKTGIGVDETGKPVQPVIGGRRKYPNLGDLLDTARLSRATRIMLCHAPTGSDWLVPTAAQIQRNIDPHPGWVATNHYLADPPRGRFQHTDTGHRVTITVTAEWFGTADLTPIQAQFSHHILTDVIATAVDRPDWPLMRSPSATGLNVWKKSFDKVRTFDMTPIDREIGELIQATEPQHRSEQFTTGGRCTCDDCIPLLTTDTIPGFAYADGRFMYHGVARKLRGSAPARMLTGPQAEALFTSGTQTGEFHKGAFHPARYRVRYTISDWWDHLGCFPIKHTDRARGWHWPNRAGFTGETWINAVELRTAIAEGFIGRVEFLDGIELTPTNSLEPFCNLIDKMLKDLDSRLARHDIGAGAHTTVSSAVKHMFRVTLGSFSRRTRYTTKFAATADAVAATAVGAVHPAANGGFTYQVPTPKAPDDDETFHPEIAALVWGQARTRVLDYRRPGTTHHYGALQIDPNHLIGIQGDAIYTTHPQPWTYPTHLGGLDDGSNGRIRIKGYLPGPLSTPASITERHDLSKQAEQHGWDDAR